MNNTAAVTRTIHFERQDIKQESIVDTITKVAERFRDSNGSYITANCQHIVDGYAHLYGIHKDHQEAPRDHYQSIKADILFYMGQLPPDTPAVQIVGDQVSFSLEGTEIAKQFLRTQITENTMVLYGYAGKADANGARCVNASVTDIVREKGIQSHVLANVVGFHTITALKQWGYTGPEELEHFMIVYGNDDSKKETGALFGDGITTSDYMANSLLLLEGGVQSFRQACNALLLGQRIIALSGLRSPTKAFFKDSFTGTLTPYFSASVFLKEIAASISDQTKAVEEKMQRWYANYFGSGKCYISDPQRGDFEMKQKLMEDAWAFFMKERLYLKIADLVTFEE